MTCLQSAVFFTFLLAPAVVRADLGACPVFSGQNIWNTAVDNLPQHPQSGAWVATIGSARGLHPDFGTLYGGAPIGIPYTTVPGSQPKVAVSFDYDDESDPGPYPIPPEAPVEGGDASDGDRHVLVVDRDNCRLYELFYAYRNADNSWRAASGAIFDLRSDALRPSGWTSADAAGLPILAGLVRYDEVASGEIRHALRFTAPQTQRAFLWPARHFASGITGAQFPPMGARLRLKSTFSLAGFAPEVQVVLRALKKYGMILADNGSSWYLSGVPDPRWNDDTLVNQLSRVKGSDFEAVDVSALMSDPDSGMVRSSSARDLADWPATEYYNTVLGHYFVTATDGERASIDSGGAGPGWSRTNAAGFKVWSTAPGADWSPVCRFYGNPAIGGNGQRLGPNSHFYTVEPGECDTVKRDGGWIYEGIAFYARRVQAGSCPAGTRPLYRAYNNRFAQNDSNHRFAVDRSVLDALRPQGWSVEGVVMCVE